MLRMTTADYETLVRTRDTLRASSESIPQEIIEEISPFFAYIERLEEDRKADMARHREALKKWRNTPSGKEKNRINNTKSMRVYRAKKREKQGKEE